MTFLQKLHFREYQNNEAHAGAAAAVRDAEGFMEIEVADIRADQAGTCEADLSIHVGTVHVNLAAVAVDDPADIADSAFEYPVGGRVGDHQAGEVCRVLDRTGFEIGDVDISGIVTFHADDFHAGHDSGSRVGAVGGNRDEADVAVAFAARLVVAVDGEQPGIFTLGTGIRLE